MVKAELKEKSPQAIIPCPRCINGQILAINAYVCFQCGHDLKVEAEQDSGKVAEETQLLQSCPLFKMAERIVCPKCGKEVCLSNQTEFKVIKPHKDPATEGAFPRPWCDMSGEVIPW